MNIILYQLHYVILQEIVFVDCEKPSEDDIEEKFSTMAIDPIDENKSDIEVSLVWVVQFQ